jgi:hypothetical protein
MMVRGVVRAVGGGGEWCDYPGRQNLRLGKMNILDQKKKLFSVLNKF